MKIIDCFTFFNELDLLEIRLNELYDSVDYFVLVEASKTQSLLDKPFYFEQNKERYTKFLDKIIHVKILNCPSNSYSWEMENFQRNCIVSGLLRIENLDSNDIIMISDLDEIPSKNSIISIKDSKSDVGSIDLDFFVYYMNFKTNRVWRGTAYCRFDNIKHGTLNPQRLRDIRTSLPLLKTSSCSGWHFGWMGGFQRLYNKLFSCIEPIDKSKIPPFNEYVRIMNECIKSRKFYNIEYSPNSETFEVVTRETQEYPQYLIDNYNKFMEYFYV